MDATSPSLVPVTGGTPQPDSSQPSQSPRSRLGPLMGAIGGIGIYFVASILGSILIILYPTIKGWDKTRTEAWLTNSTFAQFLLMLAIEFFTVALVLQLLKILKVKLKDIGIVRPKWVDIWHALAGFAVYFPIFVVVMTVMQKLIKTIDYSQKQELGFDNVAHSPQLIFVFLSLVILPPLAEEVLCRGLIYTGIRRRFKYVLAALLTSILFAIAHLQLGSGKPPLWTAAVDTFLLSMVLCYLREKTASLWPGVFLHALKNGLVFYYLYLYK